MWMLKPKILRLMLALLLVACILPISQTYPPSPAMASPIPGEIIITEFQPGHGFTYTQGGGSMVDDTTIYCRGTQSLKVTTDGNGTETIVTKTDISPTIDLTGKMIKVILRVDDINNLYSEPYADTYPIIEFASDNFASGDYFRGTETEDGGISKSPRFCTINHSAEGLSGVLNKQ